jgi:hypothetical protein
VRIAFEAAFLVAVAAALGIAETRPAAIVLVMLLAWVIVALFEWVSWREQPHWASGSPPRYHLPQESLPPRPPGLELPSFSVYPRPPVETRVPATVNDAPTWIATPEMREELLGWPAEDVPDPEPEPDAEPAPPVVEPRELPAELPAAARVTLAPQPAEPEGWPIDDDDTASDPWTAAELEPESEPRPRNGEVRQAADGAAAVAPGRASRRVRHRIDPFEGPDERRRPWRRRVEVEAAVAELPPLPRHVRLDREER